MTVLSRGAAGRRSRRRPGWLLLSALLLLAIGGSSALVFTDRVELLRLAVLMALWAAVVAAFVSVGYRRQADVDQARARDLKLVYDLQLDREISARREYELTVESQLRRELAAELHAQAADEVAALRAELTALRTNLEILFDTELDHRPALETDGAAVRGYTDWSAGEGTPADWVSSNRVTSVRQHDAASSEETAIIDVPEEPLMGFRHATFDSTAAGVGPHEAPPERYDAHVYQAPSEQRRDDGGWHMEQRHERRRERGHRGPQYEAAPPLPQYGTPAEGQGLPPGPRGGHWAASAMENPADVVDLSQPSAAATEPVPRHGRRPSRAEEDSPDEAEPGSRYREGDRRARHSTEQAAAPPWTPTESDTSVMPAVEPAARHRTMDSSSDSDGPQSGGQSVADLLARLQAEPTGGGRRRRRRKV